MAGVSQPIRRGNGYRPRVRSRRGSVGKRLGGGSAVPRFRGVPIGRGFKLGADRPGGTGRSPWRSARGRFGNAGPGAGGRKAQSLPKPQKHRAGSPEWNPQRIAERNRICPPNLRNRPARSSKRLRLSLRRKPRCRFKRKTHGSLEPSARRILTAGKARSRWQSGRLPNRMIRARRFPGRLPRRLRLCGIPAGRRLTIRRRRIIPMGKANIREAGIPSSGRSRRLTMEGRLIRRLTPIRIKLPMVIPARRPGIKGSLVTRKAAGIPSSQPSRRGPALCLRLLSLPKRRLESFQMPSRRRKRG